MVEVKSTIPQTVPCGRFNHQDNPSAMQLTWKPHVEIKQIMVYEPFAPGINYTWPRIRPEIRQPTSDAESDNAIVEALSLVGNTS
jgi:hypothetical protein